MQARRLAGGSFRTEPLKTAEHLEGFEAGLRLDLGYRGSPGVARSMIKVLVMPGMIGHDIVASPAEEPRMTLLWQTKTFMDLLERAHNPQHNELRVGGLLWRRSSRKQNPACHKPNTRAP